MFMHPDDAAALLKKIEMHGRQNPPHDAVSGPRIALRDGRLFEVPSYLAWTQFHGGHDDYPAPMGDVMRAGHAFIVSGPGDYERGRAVSVNSSHPFTEAQADHIASHFENTNGSYSHLLSFHDSRGSDRHFHVYHPDEARELAHEFSKHARYEEPEFTGKVHGVTLAGEMKEAMNPTTHPERLREIRESADGAFRRETAMDLRHRWSPNTRWQLSEALHDPATPNALKVSDALMVNRALARHPNTPPDLLHKLAYEHPHDVLKNPVEPLLRLEDPNWQNHPVLSGIRRGMIKGLRVVRLQRPLEAIK